MSSSGGNCRRCARFCAASAGWPCGVAKSAFRTAIHAVPVLRGTSARPLFVTPAGMPRDDAADLVRHIAGRFRLPDALRRADTLAAQADLQVARPATVPADWSANCGRIGCFSRVADSVVLRRRGSVWCIGPSRSRQVGECEMSVFSDAELTYLAKGKLGRLATIDGDGMPHVVPVRAENLVHVVRPGDIR